MKESTILEIEALPLDQLKALWKMCYLLWGQRAIAHIRDQSVAQSVKPPSDELDMTSF